MLKSASKKDRPATLRHATNFTADLVTTGWAKISVIMVATGKWWVKWFSLPSENTFMNPYTTAHKSMTPGGMTTMVNAHAWTGLIALARKTQSADKESPMAEALAIAYIWNIVTTVEGHANGKAEAPAEMIPELIAIFKTTISTAPLLPPSLTVAYVKPAMTANVAVTTRNIKPIESFALS